MHFLFIGQLDLGGQRVEVKENINIVHYLAYWWNLFEGLTTYITTRSSSYVVKYAVWMLPS